jgi:hypothetical protein
MQFDTPWPDRYRGNSMTRHSIPTCTRCCCGVDVGV